VCACVRVNLSFSFLPIDSACGTSRLVGSRNTRALSLSSSLSLSSLAPSHQHDDVSLVCVGGGRGGGVGHACALHPRCRQPQGRQHLCLGWPVDHGQSPEHEYVSSDEHTSASARAGLPHRNIPNIMCAPLCNHHQVWLRFRSPRPTPCRRRPTSSL